MRRQRIVITGATGLIGRSVVETLKKEYDLIAVGRNPPPQGVKWVYADLNSPLDLNGVKESPDSIIYLAQSEHFRNFPERARDVFQVNVASVQTMLDWARGTNVRRFILASSGGVYGHGEHSFREDEAIGFKGPLGYYLASKQCSELLAGSYRDCYTVVILRFFFVFGPGQKGSMLIPRLIDFVKTGQPIALQGAEGIRLNPIFVDDASHAVCRALELTNSHIINVAGPNVLSMREIGVMIGEVVGREPRFHVDEKAGPRHLCGDISKMCDILGAPKVRLMDGLRLLMEHRGRSS